MDFDINEIIIEKPKEIVNEYRTLKTQNKENYGDKTAHEFLEDKIIHYIELGLKIEKEQRKNYFEIINNIDYSDKIKCYDDKQALAMVEVLDYDLKVTEIKNLLEVLKLVKSIC